MLLATAGAVYLSDEPKMAPLLGMCGLLALGGAHSASRARARVRTEKAQAPRSSSGGCSACGQSVPTALCHYHALVNCVVVGWEWGQEKPLCRPCVHKQFWTSQLVTLLFGWWSLSGLFIAPAYLLSNIEQYLRGVRRF